MPIGAECRAGGGVHFRVWAPRRKRVAVVLERSASDDNPSANRRKTPTRAAYTGVSVNLTAEADGYFSGFLPDAVAGWRYGFCLDDGNDCYPDPASRWQPDGVEGASAIVDPAMYQWHDQAWPGISRLGQIIYEMHIGTFTPEGTWTAAIEQLPLLAQTGITVLEVMPVAEFQGRFGWGYDGVDLFAPTRLYGTPDDFRRFVDEAHRHGMGVILDVVYNHFGPSGNYLGQFSADYISKRHRTDWGDAINFDGANSHPVREFFIVNAGYWIDEFHLDGLRLDAVQAIVDDSPDHILAAITRRVREAAGSRKTIVTAENEFQEARLLRPTDQGGFGLDAAWNDDFHHAARVALTGHGEYYYGDYHGTPQELISAVKWGYLYQGQWNARQEHRRGTPAFDLPGSQFVIFLQNHDQVANSAQGLRAHQIGSLGRHRALTALMLLAPGTPLLFQGQEFCASAPFLFFADHDVELGSLVRDGRQESLRQFRSLTGADAASFFADPGDPGTFAQCKLDLRERESHAAAYALHCDLLRLRREDRVFAAQRSDRVHGAVLAAEAFMLRYLGADGDDRLLLVNLGRDLEFVPPSEPLLALPPGKDWQLLWSSEDPRYGGCGTPPLLQTEWYLPAHATLVLSPQNAEESTPPR
ncbi:MAG TPA: malto-oligosyltrehalose trehalohydrolase [Pirellulales bacterium]|nr:malto-oligosyltrehalose trehalohydrolase [Pirellulales bacterium]